MSPYLSMKQSIQTLATAALATFRAAYVESMVFTEEDRLKQDYEDTHGDPDAISFSTDLDVCEEEFGPATVTLIDTDCRDFLSKAVNTGLLDPLDNELMSQAGHDFWLTRNGHGVGFWESGRGYTGKQGKALTALSKEYREINLIQGDDQKFHLE